MFFTVLLAVLGTALFIAAVVLCLVKYGKTKDKRFLMLLCLLLSGLLLGAVVSFFVL